MVGSELILQLAEELFHRHRGTRNRHIAQIYHGFFLKIEEMQRTGFLTEVQLCRILFPGRLSALKADAGIPGLRPITQPFCRVDVDAVESCASMSYVCIYQRRSPPLYNVLLPKSEPMILPRTTRQSTPKHPREHPCEHPLFFPCRRIVINARPMMTNATTAATGIT